MRNPIARTILPYFSISLFNILYRNVSYEPARDFAPIINCATFPFPLTVHRSVPVNSVAELNAFARTHPGQLAYSSPGAGPASLGPNNLAESGDTQGDMNGETG